MEINTLKQSIKQYTTFHKQGDQKNIFIFSTARSGTTWLAEMIVTQPGFKIVNEPFNLRKPEVVDNLGITTWEALLQPENKSQIEKYIRSFIENRQTDPRWPRPKLFSEQWKLITDRIIFKILFAGEDDIHWFAKTFNGETIFLVRHPIPVTLSREEFPRLRSFLKPPFSGHFTDRQIAYAHDIIAKGDAFEMGILDWCLQNAPPFKQVQQGGLLITYEQMVMEPEKVIAVMAEKFHFSHPEKMYDRLYKASGSTVKSSKESQAVLKDPSKLKENKEWLLAKWKKKVDAAQEKKAFEILDIFEINLYTYGECQPKRFYWLP